MLRSHTFTRSIINEACVKYTHAYAFGNGIAHAQHLPSRLGGAPLARIISACAKLFCPLLGIWWRENLATALTALCVLHGTGLQDPRGRPLHGVGRLVLASTV
jgi:hypothetical protein